MLPIFRMRNFPAHSKLAVCAAYERGIEMIVVMDRRFRITIGALALLAIGAGCAGGPVYESPPQTPVNLSPIEAADIGINTETTFVWQASRDAQYYEFHIFNNENNDIEQYARRNLRANDVCQGDQCSVTLSVALPFKKDHAWRVRAGNYEGLSNWTRTRFNMVGSGVVGGNNSGGVGALITPGIPNPVRPAGLEIQNETLVEFVWQSIPEATAYDFHIFDAVNTEMVDTLTELPATTLCQNDNVCRLTRTVRLSPSSAHAWRVRAINSNGRSAWTRTEFKVVR